jgi:predicted HTH domain antitoxin
MGLRMMCQVVVDIPDRFQSVIAPTQRELSGELRMLAAVKLFELGKLSSGAAAELVGISKAEFMSKLSDYGVPAITLTEEDLAMETRLA